MRNDFESNYLAHWAFKKGSKRDDHKYVARVDLPNGLYRYFYTAAEYAAYLKGEAKKKVTDIADNTKKAVAELKDNTQKKIDNTKKAVNDFKTDTKNKIDYVNKNKERLMSEKIEKGAKKVEGMYNKLDKENKYITDDYNYDKKIQQVAKNKEWQDIVKRKDPEYVYKDKEGKTVYDVDAYLAKKKHPVLDVADDVIMGRKVTMNKLDKDALVAGVADYAKTYVAMVALGTKFLIEKFKFSQGSYKEEKQAAIDYAVENKDKIIKTAEMVDSASSDPRVIQAISEGEKFIKEYGGDVQNIDVDSLQKSTGISKQDYEQIKSDYNAVKKDLAKASETYGQASKSVQDSINNQPKTTSKPKVTDAPVQTTPKKETLSKSVESSSDKKPSNNKKEDNHKYVERVETSDGNYRYFYSQEEYNAYLKAEETERKAKVEKAEKTMAKVKKYKSTPYTNPTYKKKG